MLTVSTTHVVTDLEKLVARLGVHAFISVLALLLSKLVVRRLKQAGVEITVAPVVPLKGGKQLVVVAGWIGQEVCADEQQDDLGVGT